MTTTDKPRGGLAALCVAELVCWGLLYYSLPVAVTPISDDMGWSHTTVTVLNRTWTDEAADRTERPSRAELLHVTRGSSPSRS
ncbi:hypothetical protein [Brevibacterium permense]|uniref:Uncharacterized protein n=1 Tax=Brevibacterium permense TaxID=234834 RepID=A0ABP4KYR9_9MICO|nr:hypothetical protein [Brevibacterium permense]